MTSNIPAKENNNGSILFRDAAINGLKKWSIAETKRPQFPVSVLYL